MSSVYTLAHITENLLALTIASVTLWFASSGGGFCAPFINHTSKRYLLRGDQIVARCGTFPVVTDRASTATGSIGWV